LLSIIRDFPGHYKNVVFVSVAVVDSSSFMGAAALKAMKDTAKSNLEKYVELARKLGLPAEYRMAVGTEVVTGAVELCASVKEDFPQSVVFSGQLTFCLDKLYHRFLHNQTAYAIQRRLQQRGVTTVILPIQLEI